MADKLDVDKEDRAGVVWWRIGALEKRVSRLENFIIGVLIMLAASVVVGLLALLNLPKPS